MNIYTVKCKHCGKEFEVKCTEYKYNKGEYRHYCCKKCSHTRIFSEETRQKLSDHHYPKATRYCKICGEKINSDSRTKFCSDECKHISGYINTLIKYFGFDKNVIGTTTVFNEIARIREMLRKLYWDDNLTCTDIGKQFNYHNYCNITGKIFRYLGINVRTFKESTKLCFLTGRISPASSQKYHTEWHTTWDNNSVYLRSSYETDFANELDKQKIHYDCESLRIKYFDTQRNEYRCAIPDFIINNHIYEIKSNYTLDIQNMKDKFDAYKHAGYNSYLILEHKTTNLYSL